MKPNTPHAVITVKPSLVEGYHYWNVRMMLSTLSNEINCLMGSLSVTNTSHPSMRILVHRMFVFQYQVTVGGMISPRAYPNVCQTASR
jgi:hypothetical protein